MNMIFYPPGGGGVWLSYLIYCLENNLPPATKVGNFHNEVQSANVVLAHFFPSDSRVWRNCEKPVLGYKLFSTKNTFNVYLNIVSKMLIKENTDYINGDISTKANLLIEWSSYMASQEYANLYEKSIDLDYDWIFTNPDLFLNTLFKLLDELSIKHNRNYELGQAGIDTFKASCVSPDLVKNKSANLWWVCWCIGILKANNIDFDFDFKKFTTFKDLDKLLAPHNEFCLAFTNDRILSY